MSHLRAGWTDPILANAFGASSPAAKVRLGFAWPNATAPMEIFNKSAAELSHKDDGLIFERNNTTGKTKKFDLPLQVSGVFLGCEDHIRKKQQRVPNSESEDTSSHTDTLDKP